jgi:hypothetical protein
MIRYVPTLYRWRIRQRLDRVYGALLELERDVLGHAGRTEPGSSNGSEPSSSGRTRSSCRLAFADQLYVLREHIMLVRARLTSLAAEPREP